MRTNHDQIPGHEAGHALAAVLLGGHANAHSDGTVAGSGAEIVATSAKWIAAANARGW